MFIHETASYCNTTFNGEVKLYRNVSISDSELGDGCSIGDDSVVNNSILNHHVIINRRSYINDSIIGKYTYAGINTMIQWTQIGNFCSLSRNVDIGGADHDYHKLTMLPEMRFNQMLGGGGKLFSRPPKESLCEIGNDVWIASGAIILHNVEIGDGAIIGAGAVVTRDVPPYAIVAGVPAEIIGFRCNEEDTERLLQIKWWNLEDDVLAQVGPYLTRTEITKKTLDDLEDKINKLSRRDKREEMDHS